MPAPTTTARGCDDSASALGRPGGAGNVRRCRSVMRRVPEEGVRDVGFPAGHGLAAHRREARIAHPLPQSCCAVEGQHAAPQVPVQRRVAGLPPAGRDDDAPAHRVPDRGGDARVAHRVVVHRQRGAGRQQVAQRPQLGVGVGEVADQVGGQDPVERADDAVFGEALHRACARTGPTGATTWSPPRRACPRCVDGHDLGVRGDAQQARPSTRRCRIRRRATAVRDPRRAAASLGRKSKVRMVSRAGADQPVVGVRADVERGGHLSAGQAGVTDAHVDAPIAAGRR